MLNRSISLKSSAQLVRPALIRSSTAALKGKNGGPIILWSESH